MADSWGGEKTANKATAVWSRPVVHSETGEMLPPVQIGVTLVSTVQKRWDGLSAAGMVVGRVLPLEDGVWSCLDWKAGQPWRWQIAESEIDCWEYTGLVNWRSVKSVIRGLGRAVADGRYEFAADLEALTEILGRHDPKAVGR